MTGKNIIKHIKKLKKQLIRSRIKFNSILKVNQL